MKEGVADSHPVLKTYHETLQRFQFTRKELSDFGRQIRARWEEDNAPATAVNEAEQLTKMYSTIIENRKEDRLLQDSRWERLKDMIDKQNVVINQQASVIVSRKIQFNCVLSNEPHHRHLFSKFVIFRIH